MGSNEIEIYKGDTKTLNLTVQDSSGTAQDITGATLWFTVKKNPADNDTKAIMQVNGIITNGTAGTATFGLTNANTTKESGEYTYDVQIKLTSGTIATLIKDDFTIVEDVTKATS